MVAVPRSDVLVIGAGLIGSSIALHLRWRGLSVRVLERDRVADGTSARGGGWVAAQSRPPGPHLALALASIAYYPELLERIGDDCGYLRGAARSSCSRTKSSSPSVARSSHEQRQLATYEPPVFLDRGELKSVEPAVSDAVFAATYREGDGQVDPPRMTRALVAAAKRAGVNVHLGARVTDIERDGAGWRARTTIGDFASDVVVNAAGPWAGSVARMVGADLPGRPGRRPDDGHRPSGALRALRHRRIQGPAPFELRARRATYDRRGTDGSGSAQRSDRDRGIRPSRGRTPRSYLAASSHFSRAFAARSSRRPGRACGPIRATAYRSTGSSTTCPGHFVAVPLAGICESAIAGKAMAELIATGTSATPLDAFSPRRFNATPLAV